MSPALFFWILMLLWLVSSLMANWPRAVAPGQNRNYWPLAGIFFIFVLIATLGWHDFGAPIH